MKVGIVGGGICGLSAALALRKAGIPFHLFERAAAFHEVGAGILLSGPVVEIFKKIGVGDAFIQEANLIKTVEFTNRKLQHVMKVPGENEVYSIHRIRLIELLSRSLDPSDFTLGAQIDSVSNTDDFAEVTVNGNSIKFDIIIASDGISSLIRKQFLPEIEVRNVKQEMWRGLAKLKGVESLHHLSREMWGRNRRFGFVHLGGDLFFWWGIRWIRNQEEFHLDNIKQDLLGYFSGFHPVCDKFISHGYDIFRTTLRDILPNKNRWSAGRVVFAGDSVHACTPDLAQGAGQAIESAYVLSLCLKKYGNNYSKAFIEYQKARQNKVRLVGYHSFRMGRFSHQRKDWQDTLTHLIIRNIPDYFFKKKQDEILNIRYLKELE